MVGRVHAKPTHEDMFAPRLTARMEQGDDLTGFRVNAAEIRPFEYVTVEAGQGQIARLVCPARAVSRAAARLKKIY